MATQAQRDAIKKYDAANTKQLHLKLNTTTDKEILEHIDRQKNMQGYVKSLIKADMDKKTRRMLLTIRCKTGTEFKQLVNYLHMEDGRLCYTMDKPITTSFGDIVRIPIENIESYDLEMVELNGWKLPSE